MSAVQGNDPDISWRTVNNLLTLKDDLCAKKPQDSSSSVLWRSSDQFMETVHSPLTSIGFLPPEQEHLLHYFSTAMVPQLDLIDSKNDDWRQLVIPIAQTDALVMNAVLAASLFHFAAHVHSPHYVFPSTFYQNVIDELQRRKDLMSHGIQAMQFVCLSITVLLTTVIIQGYADFLDLFSTLKSAVRTIGGEQTLSNGPVGQFVCRLIRKMSIYARPLVDHDTGEVFIRSEGVHREDSVSFRSDSQSLLSTSTLAIVDLVHQAYSIYLHRVSVGPSTPMMKEQISNFKTTIQSFAVDSPTPSVVLWATFVAAAETETPEDRQFFETFLLGFGNSLAAENLRELLQWLKDIWEKTEQATWPLVLPSVDLFVA